MAAVTQRSAACRAARLDEAIKAGDAPCSCVASRPPRGVFKREMTLKLDTSRAIRTLDEKLALVKAIHDAPRSEPELEWVEWKSTWDLTRTAHKFETAKHVLGFGNRMVQAAQQTCEGCAYFLAGVEPQNLCGTTPLDPSPLTQALRRYIAAHHPRWSPDYVEVDGKAVLIITVEASRAGDRACTLQHGYENFEKGAVFVRRHGQTVRPDQIEVAALEDRFAAHHEATIGLVLERDDEPSRELKLLAIDDASRAEWIRNEEAGLLASLPTPPQPRPPGSIGALAAGLGSLPSFSMESRSKDGFREEVANYVEHADTRWYRLLAEKSFERQDSALVLRLKNTTSENYSDVEVIVDVPAGLRAYDSLSDLEDELHPPEPPEPWGTSIIRGIYDHAPDLSHLIRKPEPEVEADRDGEPIQVIFTVPAVRPKESISLPLAFVLSGDEAIMGQTVEFRWSLTTRSTSGTADDNFRYRIADNPINHAPSLILDQNA
jgi:hypothetical protein